MAAQWAGFENIFQVEIDNYCQKVLAKNFQNVKRYKDIKDFDGTEYRGTVDIVSGGFPCQPFSIAGKQKGAEDDRNLWPEMFRIIQEIRPAWVLGENVINIQKFMEFERACLDLESENYKVQAFIIPAISVDAIHTRNRIWIIANATGIGWNSLDKSKQNERAGEYFKGYKKIIHSDNVLPTMDELYTGASSGVLRNDDGLSEGVDRLKGLGNAIVPQVAYTIFEAIKRTQSEYIPR